MTTAAGNAPKVHVFSDTPCELGEGPSFDGRTNALFWFDILGKTLLEQREPGGETRVHALPFMASAIAAVDGDRQLIAAEDGLYLRDRKTGALTLHTPLEADNALTRSNDGRVHPCGALWIGTMALDEAAGKGAIYWFFRGELRRLYEGVGIPNSICFSPDGATAYFADSAARKLWCVACDPLTGLPQREPALFVDGTLADGFIDGSVVDAAGVLWNARWGGSRLDAYAPDGKFLRSVALPALQTSCPAFTGADASRLVVTSARKGMDAGARAADPLGGQTFLVDLPVKGRVEPDLVL